MPDQTTDSQLRAITERTAAACRSQLDAMLGRPCDAEALRAIESTMHGALMRLIMRGELLDLGIHHAVDLSELRFIASQERGRVAIGVEAPMAKVRGEIRV